MIEIVLEWPLEKLRATKTIDSYMKVIEKALPHVVKNKKVADFLDSEYAQLLKWDEKLHSSGRISQKDKIALRKFVQRIRGELRQKYDAAQWLVRFSELAAEASVERRGEVAIGDETTGELKKGFKEYGAEQAKANLLREKKAAAEKARKRRIRAERPHMRIVRH